MKTYIVGIKEIRYNPDTDDTMETYTCISKVEEVASKEKAAEVFRQAHEVPDNIEVEVIGEYISKVEDL